MTEKSDCLSMYLHVQCAHLDLIGGISYAVLHYVYCVHCVSVTQINNSVTLKEWKSGELVFFP